MRSIFPLSFKYISLSLLTGSFISVAGLTYAASGGIVAPVTTSGSIIENQTGNTGQETISILLPFEGENMDVIKSKISKLSWTITNDKAHWSFQLLPDTYILSPKTYLQFNGQEFPVEHGIQHLHFPQVQRYILTISRKTLLDYIINNIAPEINRSKQDVTIKRENGKIIFEGTAEDGQQVDTTGLVQLMIQAIKQNINHIRTPVLYQRALVHKIGLDDVNIKELIGTGISDFSGSPSNRIHNIHVGIQRYNGVIIKKGETFSFVKQLGPVDAANGFLPELVIKGPDTIPEFGGGLCQVSTTMFRAALFSGLPINERRNHSYAVQYYVWPLGWGFDATIYIGAVDLKFTNDTPGDILVQAYTDKSRAYYKFYGISDARTVDINGPFITGRRAPPPPVEEPTSSLPPGVKKLKEKAHAGLSAYFIRTVTYPNGEVKKEKFTSIYEARPMVYTVGSAAAPATTDQFYSGEIGTKPTSHPNQNTTP